MSGSSKDFFDFNHDGKIEAFEGAGKLEFYDEISKDHSSEYEASLLVGGGKRVEPPTCACERGNQ